MKLHLVRHCAPETTDAAVRVLARLLLRDGKVDSKELELLERMNAFQALGIERGAFLQVLDDLGAERSAPRQRATRVFEPELHVVDSRPLQLLICSFLVAVVDADGQVAPEESAFVRQAFYYWNVSPEALRRAMRIPVHQSLAALGMLPEAA